MSDYRQVRDAAGNVTSHYGKMLQEAIERTIWLRMRQMDALLPECEARLEKAVRALDLIATHRKKCHEYDDDVGHERREFDVEDVIIMENAARTTLAELKGEDRG